MEGYNRGRRDMLRVFDMVISAAREMGIADDEMDINVLLDGITLGLMESEDRENG